MLITLALIFGAVIGVVLHFALPERETRGAALAPMIAALVAGAVWLLFTWLGLAETGWIWLAAIAAPIAVTWPLIVVLSRARLAHDARERARLKLA
jgi:hypothetical protein